MKKNTHRNGIQDFRFGLGRRPVLESFAKGKRVEPFGIGLDLCNTSPASESALAGHRMLLKTCLSSRSAAPRTWESHHCGSGPFEKMTRITCSVPAYA